VTNAGLHLGFMSNIGGLMRFCLYFFVACFSCSAFASAAPSPPSGPQLGAIAKNLSPLSDLDTGRSAGAPSLLVNKDVLVELRDLRKSVQDATEKSKASSERSTKNAILTVLGSGVLALLAQWLLMRHQRAQSEKQARGEVANTYADWQLKQLSEFYGPLRALLFQSNVMYRQMNKMLVDRAPDIFRLVDQSSGDFDNKLFEIRCDDVWVQFRTVKHLDKVYGCGYGVEPIFDAKLISERAGYVRGDQDELAKVLGRYLAHFVTLRTIVEHAKNPAASQAPYVNEGAVFPVGIQGLVDVGFRQLGEELRSWRHGLA